jgi:hypothetical protein
MKIDRVSRGCWVARLNGESAYITPREDGTWLVRLVQDYSAKVIVRLDVPSFEDAMEAVHDYNEPEPHDTDGIAPDDTGERENDAWAERVGNNR